MRRIYFFAYWGAALASFALGYGLSHRWYWAFAALACALPWLLAGFEYPSPCLCASILVAALGILLSVPEPPMILGASASLGLWDFARAGIPAAKGEASREALENYRKTRLPYLLLALGIGTLAAILGSGLSFRIPFFAMALCVLACAFGLDRMIARLRDKR
jgi:hypothetical protein